MRLALRRPNAGLPATLNWAPEQARAPLVAIQDQDDVSLPRRLEVEAALLESRPALALVGSAFELIDGEGTASGTRRPPQTHTRIRWASLFRAASDCAFWSQLTTLGQAANVEEPLVRYRRHPMQMSVVHAADVGRSEVRSTLATSSRRRSSGRGEAAAQGSAARGSPAACSRRNRSPSRRPRRAGSRAPLLTVDADLTEPGP